MCGRHGQQRHGIGRHVTHVTHQPITHQAHHAPQPTYMIPSIPFLAAGLPSDGACLSALLVVGASVVRLGQLGIAGWVYAPSWTPMVDE